jgi:hypothetical protein
MNGIFELLFQHILMIETINMLLLKKFAGSALHGESAEFINQWLIKDENFRRLQRECDKIWLHQFEDHQYDAERAFRVLGQRLSGVSRQELS